jgi:hypothetical protein
MHCQIEYFAEHLIGGSVNVVVECADYGVLVEHRQRVVNLLKGFSNFVVNIVGCLVFYLILCAENKTAVGGVYLGLLIL